MIVDGEYVVSVIGEEYLAIPFGIVVDEDSSSVEDQCFFIVEVKILSAILDAVAVDVLQLNLRVGRTWGLLRKRVSWLLNGS